MKTQSFNIGFLRLIGQLLPLFICFFIVHPAPAVHAADGDFAWAVSMGGPVEDQGHGIYVDSSGNVYTTGSFEGTVDFDPGPATVNLSSPNTTGIFISKLDSGGNLVWARGIGGNLYDDVGFGIYADSAGNVYATGYFQGTVDFDPGPGTYNLASEGSSDIFICKLDRDGSFVWARSMGGTSADYGYGIFADSAGNVYTTGYFQGTLYYNTDNAGPSVTIGTTQGVEDIFISKLGSGGNFLWVKTIGSTDSDEGLGISLFSGGYIYTTGYFRGTVSFGPYTLISNGPANDIFVCKMDGNGNFIWARRMGGMANDMGNSIALDPAGNVYTTGRFEGTADFDPAAGTVYNLTSDGLAADIFISKLNRNGNFVWARRIGAASADIGYGISVNSSGNVFTTGFFQGTVDFDPGAGTAFLSSASGSSVFISKLNSSGNFIWAKDMGANIILGDTRNSIYADSSGNVHTTGYFRGTDVDFDPGAGTYPLSSVSPGTDIFISKLSGTDVPPVFPWPMFLPAITNNAQP